MSGAPLAGLAGKMKTLLDRWTSALATKLDTNVDAKISLTSLASTALSTANWTNGRALLLDHLDKDISEIKTVKYQSVLKTTGTSWTVPAGLIGDTVIVSMIGGGGGGSSTTLQQGQGGNAGFALQKIPYVVGATVTYSIGAGGAGQTGAGNGSDGTDTTFGTLTAAGGEGGSQNSSAGTGGALGGRYYSSNHDWYPGAVGGPFGGINSAGYRELGGASGLIFDDTLFTTDGDGSGYGAGGYGMRGSSANGHNGEDGAILIEWFEEI